MANRHCDCGGLKTPANGTDILVCDHCDTGTCGGSCNRCASYKAGIARRIATDKP